APDQFEISVPASIANLGPGFDTLAVAVRLYLHLRVKRVAGRDQLRFHFSNAHIDGENYIERAFLFLSRQRGGHFPSLDVEVETEIPTKSGLGSSAAATVAGLRLYEAIAGSLPEQGLLNAACALEHHPDNVAAALFGGLTISCQLPDRSVTAVQMKWPQQLEFIVLTPHLPLSTAQSRSVLPERVPLEDAIFNLQRVALLLRSLQNENFSLLREALCDRLHQPSRQELVPGLERALALQHPDLLGVCLSGAGPSIVALAVRNFDEIGGLLAESFRETGLTCCVRHLRVHEN
ncbi:MAG TPA: homoserine kinase, partial [Bryobacteraceae bacterium]|nr:homoserine kinase [Bryobacteraceae bacterium]